VRYPFGSASPSTWSIRVLGQLDRNRVDGLGNVVVLDAHCDEIVDREEAPNVACRVAPPLEAVVLAVDGLAYVEVLRAGCERKAERSVAELWTAVAHARLDLFLRERLGERVTEAGDDHPPVTCIPVDVEPAGGG
jgi:hypothetical protein